MRVQQSKDKILETIGIFLRREVTNPNVKLLTTPYGNVFMKLRKSFWTDMVLLEVRFSRCCGQRHARVIVRFVGYNEVATKLAHHLETLGEDVTLELS